MDLSIIIVSRNTGEMLRRCLASLSAGTGGLACEVVVVDNASRDGSPEVVRTEFPRALLIANDTNAGFGRACNQGMARTTGEYILLLNADTQVVGTAIPTMVAFMRAHAEVGALGCRLLNADGSFQASCRRFPTLRTEVWERTGLSRLFPRSPLFAAYRMAGADFGQAQEVDQLMGACLLLRRAALEAVGPMDEGFFLYYEEVDLCFRLKQAGWKIYYLPEAQVIHHGGQSSQQELGPALVALTRSTERFFAKHYGCAAALLLRLLTIVEMGWRLPYWAGVFLCAPSRRAEASRWFRGYLRVLAVSLIPRTPQTEP